MASRARDGGQETLGLTERASDADVARLARAFCAAKLAEEQASCGPTWLHAQVELDAALADLMLVTGYGDAFEGTGHDDRPERVVPVAGEVL